MVKGGGHKVDGIDEFELSGAASGNLAGLVPGV